LFIGLGKVKSFIQTLHIKDITVINKLHENQKCFNSLR